MLSVGGLPPIMYIPFNVEVSVSDVEFVELVKVVLAASLAV